MYCGPNLQKDLLSLIINWRQYKYAITADIEMFRTLHIRKCDQPLQSIIWRDSSNHLQQFHLTTVTYGTKAAPYLAMRTLRQLAIDEMDNYPLAAPVVKSSFYMDDILSGMNDGSQARELQQQLIKMLRGAGMNLRKWSSNHAEILQGLTTDLLNSPYEFKCFESRKTLGLKWTPSSDTFALESQISSNNEENITKRQLLSDISKLFDPLGWISPLTIRAKLLFQTTWVTEASWDQVLPNNICNNWLKLKDDLKNVNKFSIPRYLGNLELKCQLHAFCDASDKAYACAIYLVTQSDKGMYTSNLVVAKTRLAPVAKKVSLPRLELCGALLLSQLVKKVIQSLPSNHMSIHAWTDSMIVLGWLDGDVSRWKSFVANRVSQITKVIPITHWNHVSSGDNAADCATRGLTSLQLMSHSLWWEGPTWLKQFDAQKVKKTSYHTPTAERKAPSVYTTLRTNNISFITELLQNQSSLTRIVRIVGWVSRFIKRIQFHVKNNNCSLSSSEIDNAYHLIIKEVQYQDFSQELHDIKHKGHVHYKSKICSLIPFLDDSGILRVGGRLKHASLSESAKHPIILSSHSRFTNLLIDQAHVTTLHGGPRLTLSYIRDRYWIISGVRTVKRQLRLCVRCRRFSHTENQQIMGDLPSSRITPSRPFTHTGVDFTGHVELKANKGRGIKTVKGYIAVFVCLSTKAVHLELVSDLGTPAFLAAFRRFCSRRGSPGHMYSDNGTNFVGANRLMKKEYLEIIQNINSDFIDNISMMNVHWHFNAPAWPNAGGLWERAVRSLKYHLKRVLGDQLLTYEEFSTLLCQIEACLNSRPLCQLLEDKDSIDCLTPGHFLVGGPILSRPATEPESTTLTSRWQLVQGMVKNIWKRWSMEYLQQLQTRSKWRQPKKNIDINDIVLIKDENSAPGKWPMARVQEVHSGKDGYVRVVTLKTRNNIIQRPVNKLVPLPTNEQSTSETSKPQHRTRRTASLKSFLITAICLFTFITPTFQQKIPSYNITPITTNQGLYFDRMSDLQIIKDEWKIVVYYNLSTYYRGISNIKNYVTHLKDTAANMGQQYDSVISQLEHEVDELEHYQTQFKNTFLRRSKRGLINGVGYLANSLFGVLDERFAEQYKQDIEKIAHNENHLQNMLRNQTIILESEYNILRRNEATMNKQFIYINQHLRNVSIQLNRVSLDNRNGLYVTSTALAASIILSSLMRIQHVLIDTVTDISHGRIDPYLLSPEQLAQQLNIISGQLKGSLDIPVETYNLSDLYKIIKASSRLHDNYLLIEVKIPLVNNDIYELDKIISIPQKRVQNQVRLLSTLPYIGYNVQQDTALLLSDNDIQACIQVTNSNKILCSLDKPLYHLKIKQSLCDIQTLNIETTICKQEVSTCRNYWFKLHNINSWLYSCCEICHLRIFCKVESTTTFIKGNGIINIGQGCTLKSDDFTIYAHNHYLRYVNIEPKIEVPKVSVLNTVINTSLPDDLIIPESQKAALDHMQDQISSLKEQSSTELSVHDVHQYSVGYTTLALVIVFGIIGLYFFIKTRRAISEQPSQDPGALVRVPVQHLSPLVVGPRVGLEVSECASGSVPVKFSALSKSVGSVSVDKGTSPMIAHRSVDLSFLTNEQD